MSHNCLFCNYSFKVLRQHISTVTGEVFKKNSEKFFFFFFHKKIVQLTVEPENIFTALIFLKVAKDVHQIKKKNKL